MDNVWGYIQENPLLAISAILGLVVLIILVYLYFQLRRKGTKVAGKKSNKEAAPATDANEAAPSPYTLTDIRRAMARGMSQEAISELLKGVQVRWLGDLMHARPQGEDLVKVTIEFEDVGIFPVVFCTVPLSRYPQLKEVYQGTQVTVQGTISAVSDMHVSLDNAVLSLGI
jgi:hypothetical protein